MEIDTWVGASGKNGMRRDWLLRSQVTGIVFIRATRYDEQANEASVSIFFQSIAMDTKMTCDVWWNNSTWVMMNKETRRLSKMPDEVRAEIAPWFIEKHAIEEESPEKIEKLDANARYMHSNLKVSVNLQNFNKQV